MSIPQAGILASSGGYQPFRVVDRAHQHGALTIVLTGGVRSSKSISTGAEVVSWFPHSDLLWLAGDTYDLSRQEFEYAMEAMLSLGWTKRHLITLPRSKYLPCVMESIWGTILETRSLKDVNTFVARAPDFIGLCEPGLADPGSVQKARERLSTRAGRLWAAGTFEEAKFNWLETYWRKGIRWPNPESIKSFTAPTWLNRTSFPLGKHDPGIQLLRNSARDMDEFLLRCGGVPVTHKSEVIGDTWNPGVHLGEVKFTRRNERQQQIPVELAVDPGFRGSNYSVLAIQREACPVDECKSERLRVIDEISVTNMVYQKVIEEARYREWWPNASAGVCDPRAGKSFIFGAPSTQMVWLQEGNIRLRLPPAISVEELVGVLRDCLMDPVSHHAHIIVDRRCERLIWEMTNWRKKKTAEGYGHPSEKNCDSVKALAYYCTDWWGKRLYSSRPEMDDPYSLAVQEVRFH
jgi:hypothetical protein